MYAFTSCGNAARSHACLSDSLGLSQWSRLHMYDPPSSEYLFVVARDTFDCRWPPIADLLRPGPCVVTHSISAHYASARPDQGMWMVGMEWTRESMQPSIASLPSHILQVSYVIIPNSLAVQLLLPFCGLPQPGGMSPSVF